MGSPILSHQECNISRDGRLYCDRDSHWGFIARHLLHRTIAGYLSAVKGNFTSKQASDDAYRQVILIPFSQNLLRLALFFFSFIYLPS